MSSSVSLRRLKAPTYDVIASKDKRAKPIPWRTDYKDVNEKNSAERRGNGANLVRVNEKLAPSQQQKVLSIAGFHMTSVKFKLQNY